MKFLLDECCMAQLANEMRDAGYDASYVLEEIPGATDNEVLAKAYKENRILITEDKDFGELVFRLRKDVIGIILLRFSVSNRYLVWPRLEELLSLKATGIKNKFIVVDEEKSRIRPLL